MNKLEEQIRKAIESEKSVPYNFDEEDIEAASELCTIIAIEFAKDFAIWVNRNTAGCSQLEDVWYYRDKTGRYNTTTDKLINLYIESLK